MNIGVLGTGNVGEAIATALIEKGHQVKMGSRTAANEKATNWIKKAGKNASQGTFNEAATFGELLFLCLNGTHAIDAIQSVELQNVKGKIIVDITNPLDFSHGMPPTILDEYSIKSLGEHIQDELPASYVVKTLNTVNYKLMVDAREVNKGDHHLFICGNDSDAKNKIKHFLVDNFHWKPDHFIDLGPIQNARCIEAIVPFWVCVWQALETPLFNFKIVHQETKG
ncbi:MAG: NADPH-dependent F420 reductase [Flavisolibacter sp.]